jgi:hypothetical protein
MSLHKPARIALVATLLAASSAHAQLFRAYLASDGGDANPCTLAQPCRLLPAALAAVASGGEIWMLDSANYNASTVTIGKSVSILAIPGAVGSIVALNGGPAISITASGLTIALRNVVIGPVAGATPGTHGIEVTGNVTLSIENSLIASLPVDGVRMTGASTLRVSNTTFRNNNNYAIYLLNGPRAAIAATQMLGNGNGVLAWSSTPGLTSATVSDSVISGGNEGLYALADVFGAIVRISIARSTVERMSYALDAETSGVGTAEVYFGESFIVENDSAWYQLGTGSAVYSFGNNQMNGNLTFTGSKTTLTPL